MDGEGLEGVIVGDVVLDGVLELLDREVLSSEAFVLVVGERGGEDVGQCVIELGRVDAITYIRLEYKGRMLGRTDAMLGDQKLELVLKPLLLEERVPGVVEQGELGLEARDQGELILAHFLPYPRVFELEICMESLITTLFLSLIMFLPNRWSECCRKSTRGCMRSRSCGTGC